MKRFSSTGRQNRARWVLIFGVLAGLFFSGGEGIQLFPFPFAEANNSKITASVPEQNPKSYAFSVFSSRNYSTQLKSKFQKDTDQYLSGGGWKLDRSETRINFCLPPAQNRKEANLSHISLVLSSQSDRAPPMV
ncbi:MAG TPA: hypothetical protein VNB22_20940 [Pyrinomonadaceae bacterium]|jgi:hypothetical protein|nr:hypothetical protein [Pyrinomonadaceae bacterium]